MNFIMLDSFCKAIHNYDKLPEKQLKLVMAIIDYGCKNIVPSFDQDKEFDLQMAFDLIRPVVDNQLRNYNNGKKGGRPKKETPQQSS